MAGSSSGGLTLEQEAALEIARTARSELIAAQRAYRGAMRNAFATGLPDHIIARRIGAKRDAVRMFRKRSRV